MDLKDWLEQKKWGYADLARECEFDPETGRRYALKKRVPKKPHGQKIFVVTGGQVAPNDFYDLPELLPAGAPV